MSAGAPHRLLAHTPRLYGRHGCCRYPACAVDKTWEPFSASGMLKLCILGEPPSFHELVMHHAAEARTRDLRCHHPLTAVGCHRCGASMRR